MTHKELLSHTEVDNIVNEWITDMLSESNVTLPHSVEKQTEYLLRPEGLGLGVQTLESSALTPTERALKTQLRQRKRKVSEDTEENTKEQPELEDEAKWNLGSSKKKRKIVQKATKNNSRKT